MAFNRRYNNFGNTREKRISCSCGGNAKLSSIKNYPFGKKSKGRTSWFYKCTSCKKRTQANSKGGGR